MCAQINLGGSIGVPGSVAVLGNYGVVFTSDADHTLTATEWSNNFLELTSSGSLTATRNLIAPLNQGQSFVVQNNTTGGQSINVVGSSGSGVMVPNGNTVSLLCDGFNYLQTVGAPNNAVSSSLTFAPYGVASSNVFTTEASLAIATQALNGSPYTIVWDLGGYNQFYEVQTVGLWDLGPSGSWTDNETAAYISFSNGTILHYSPSFLPSSAMIVGTVNNGSPGTPTVQDTTGGYISIAGLTSFEGDGVSAFYGFYGQGPIPWIIDWSTLGTYGLSDGPAIYTETTSSTPVVEINVYYSRGLINGTVTSSGEANIGITLFDGSSIEPNGVPSAINPSIFAFAIDCNVDTSWYSTLVIEGLYLDDSDGYGPIAIRPGPSINKYMLSQGVLYQSNGAEWIPNPFLCSTGVIVSNTALSDGYVLTATSSTTAEWSAVPPNLVVPFVFRPGGIAGGNIFTTTDSLVAATLALSGAAYTIIWDLSLVGGVFGLPNSFNLGPNGTWTDEGLGYTIEFTDDTILPFPPAAILGTLYISVTQPGVTCVVTASTGSFICTGSIFSTGSAFLSFELGSPPGNWVFYFSQQSIIGGGGGPSYAIDFGNANATALMHDQSVFNSYSVGNGNVVNLFLFDVATINADSLGIGDVATYSINAAGPGATVDPSYYPELFILGLYVDNSGTGLTTIIAGNNANALLLTNNVLYEVSSSDLWVMVGLSPSIIFQPGGTTQGNIAGNENDLSTLVQGFNGTSYTILFDLSISGSPYTFTTVGELYLANNGIWTDEFNNYSIVFANETTLAFPPIAICGTLNVSSTQSDTVCVLTQAATTDLNDSSNISTSNGYFIDTTSAGWVVNTFSASVFNGSDLTTGSNFIFIYAYDGSQIAGTAPPNVQVVVSSPGVSIDSSYFTSTFINGSFTDSTNTATSIIPPGNSWNVSGYIFQNDGLYYGDGSEWLPVNATSFVFQPGGTVGGNFLVTETALAAATQALNGAAYTIFFDLSLVAGSYTFTTVGALDLGPNGTWTDGGFGYFLVFANGTTLTYPPIAVEGAITLFIGQAGQNVSTSNGTIRFSNSVVVNGNSGAFVAASVGNLTIHLQDNVTLNNGAIAGNGNQLTVYAYDFATITGGSVDGSTNLTIEVSSSGVVVASEYYPDLVIAGIFIDIYGGAISTILPSFSKGSFVSDSTTNTLYVSTGTAWQPSTVPTSFVFQPAGVVSGSNVYITETALANATQQLNGAPYTIFIDLSQSGPYTFTTVGDLNLAPNGTWTDGGVYSQLTFANETTLTNCPDLKGSLSILVSQTTDVNTVIPTTGYQVNHVGEEVEITNAGGTSGSWYNANTYAGVAVFFDDLAYVYGGGGTNAVFRSTTTDTFLTLALNDSAYFGVGAASASGGGFTSITPNTTQAFIDPSLYPLLVYPAPSAIFNDPGTTGPSTIPVPTSAGPLLQSNGQWYRSDGSSWVPF